MASNGMRVHVPAINYLSCTRRYSRIDGTGGYVAVAADDGVIAFLFMRILGVVLDIPNMVL